MLDPLPLFSPDYAALERLIEGIGVAAVMNAVSEICSRKNAQQAAHDAQAADAWSKPVRRARTRRRRDYVRQPVRCTLW